MAGFEIELVLDSLVYNSGSYAQILSIQVISLEQFA